MAIEVGEYYTYIYYDPSRNNEPIYVGKGTKKRAWKHLTRNDMHPFTQRLQLMERNGVKPIIGLYAGMSNNSACLLEMELISLFGRRDLNKGSLLNLTDGGDSGPKGFVPIFSEEHRQKLSNSAIGKPKSDVAKQRMSEAKQGKPNGRKGIYKTSEETKKKISGTLKGRKLPETAPQRKTGRKASQETKDKMRESRQKFLDSRTEEDRQKHALKTKESWVSRKEKIYGN